MKFRYLLTALVASSIAASAVATDKDSKIDPEAPKERKICRTESVTGSLITKRRICLTQAKWDELYAVTKKGLDDTFRNAAGGANHSWQDPSPGAAGG